jgi:lysozyme
MADISSNNGFVSIPNYSRAGHAIIGIKATEGKGYINPGHITQSTEAHEYGLTVIHYHYFDIGTPVSEQIANFRNQYNKAWRKGDKTAYDIEVGSWNAWEVRNLFKMYSADLLYTYESFYKNQLIGLKFPAKMLWLADYGGTPSQCLIHQYTDGKEGSEPHFYSGIGKCDGSTIDSKLALRCLVRKKITKKRK